jgi:2-haloalkanoic acid dehalogenase type II
VTDGVSLDPATALRVLFDTRPAAEAPEYQSYREILTDAAVRVGQRLRWTISRERAAFLPESLPHWNPFPDTNDALNRLSQAGYALGILSNVDDDLLAGTRRHLVATFSVLVTAEQVRSYKPAPAHFTIARDRIGARRWLHAAQSYFHDVTPAVAARIPVAWIKRKGEQPTGAERPDREFRTLTELADWLV